MTSSHRGSKSAMVLALTGIAATIAVSAYQIGATQDALFKWLVGGMAATYIVWILAEFRVAIGENKRDKGNDQGTCEAYAIARFITMLTAFAVDSVWSRPGLWLPAGLTLFFGGIALRACAIRTLGRFYSHRVRTPEGRTIVSTGPYRFLRHPAYAGMLLAHIGVLVLFFNGFLLVTLVGVFVPALVRRIRVEEGHLLAIPEYREFAATRARLAPGIW